MNKKDLFPRLNDDQINLIKELGNVVSVKRGDKLIEVGERNHNLLVVLEGAIGIYDENNRELTIHHPGEFSGNSDSLSERASVYNAVANCDSVVVLLDHEQLRELIGKDQELSEVLLHVFLMRSSYELEHNIGTVKLIGSRYCPHTFRLREFLSKNHVQYKWIDLEKDKSAGFILSSFNISQNETPIIISNQKIYRDPSLEQIAEVLGISSSLDEEIFDVIIVGAGPAGLAASVYASSEGLNVVTIDSIGPGGQAGASSKIENYLGFPTGISGSELANNAYIQAQKFGCVISIPHTAKSLSFRNNAFHLELESGKIIKGSTVIAATGAKYRRLPLENLSQFEGRGIYYGATHMEAQTLSDKEIIIVGGGNSAGQAAMFLSRKASKVHMVVREDDLESYMSSYLIGRIENSDKIEVHLNSEVKELLGEESLEQVVVEDNRTNKKMTFDIKDVFLFLGADSCASWLEDITCLDDKGFIYTGRLEDITCLDDKGFIYTGRDIPEEAFTRYKWPLKRQPLSLETCVPGLFAVGDTRSGSVKRVASAVGEGAMAVSQVHSFLSRNF